MYENMEIADRLKRARIDAGFRSAAEAANRFGWTGSTYASHENGTRGCKPEDVQKYATALGSDPCYIMFGTAQKTATIAGVSENSLAEIIQFVLQHEGAKDAPPAMISELVLDICKYVSKSGDGGLSNVVDFAFHRRASSAR